MQFSTLQEQKKIEKGYVSVALFPYNKTIQMNMSKETIMMHKKHFTVQKNEFFTPKTLTITQKHRTNIAKHSNINHYHAQ